MWPSSSVLNLLVMLATTILISCSATKVYQVDYQSQADVKVYAVDYESQADLVVWVADYQSQVCYMTRRDDCPTCHGASMAMYINIIKGGQ